VSLEVVAGRPSSTYPPGVTGGRGRPSSTYPPGVTGGCGRPSSTYPPPILPLSSRCHWRSWPAIIVLSGGRGRPSSSGVTGGRGRPSSRRHWRSWPAILPASLEVVFGHPRPPNVTGDRIWCRDGDLMRWAAVVGDARGNRFRPARMLVRERGGFDHGLCYFLIFYCFISNVT
jgi:hypothetical protein